MVLGRGAAEVLPAGLFPHAVFEVGLPPLWRWQAWVAESSMPIRSSGRLPSACSNLSSSPLTLRGVVLTSLVCLSRAPAFRQVRVAMLAEGSFESPSILVLAFHSSLFLVEGSSDGSAPGDRFLSPGQLCLFTPFSVEISRFGAVSPGVMGFSSSSGLSVYCRIRWHLSSRKLFGVPVGLESSSPLHGWVLFDLVPILSWVFSPGFGRVPPSLGWDCTGLVAWLLLAPRGWRPPCQSTLVARSVVLWRWCVRTSVFTLFPHVVRGTLIMTGRSRHCRITAGLASMDIPLLVSSVESQLWGSCSWLYRASWLAQGGIPLLRLLPYF